MAMLGASSGAAPAHLRSGTNNSLLAPDAASDTWQLQIQSLVSGLVQEREPAAAQGTEETHTKKAGPLHMQVPEKELKAMMSKLTAQCEEQFDGIIRGQGPAIHTYGSPGTNSSTIGCRSLNGSICSMDAHVIQQKDTGGRSMSSTTSVQGDGCLPRNCMAGTDLEVLATFMHLKAKDALPGQDVNVKLSVDCTKVGGSSVEVGSSVMGAKTAHKAPVRGMHAKSAAHCAAPLVLAGIIMAAWQI